MSFKFVEKPSNISSFSAFNSSGLISVKGAFFIVTSYVLKLYGVFGCVSLVIFDSQNGDKIISCSFLEYSFKNGAVSKKGTFVSTEK